MSNAATPSLMEYQDEFLPDYSEFSHKYEFFKMFRTCLSLQYSN
jgi:hypothetical protein